MAWTSVNNVSAGSVLTATAFNDQVLGNLTALRGDYARAKLTSGNLTLNSANWANVSTSLDLTLAAEAGDVIEYAMSALLGGSIPVTYFDVVTVVSGNPVNSWGYDGTPANPPTSMGLAAYYTSTETNSVSGSVFRKLVSGDVSAGTVLLRLRYAQQSASNRTMTANAAQPIEVWARNHGPVEI